MRSLEFCSDPVPLESEANECQRARDAERERIARELHDTLLQGVQALLFRLETWARDPSISPPLQQEILIVTEQTRGMVREGREAICNLRGLDSKLPTCMLEAISEASRVRGLGISPPMEIRIEGHPRKVLPEPSEHLTAIVIEALQNIATHSQAAAVVITLDFRGPLLSVTIADNGVGFDIELLSRLSELGRFGIIGMHERADLLSADLSVQTKPGAGTIVHLVIPAEVYA
jgi:signal transduction histidine kinase